MHAARIPNPRRDPRERRLHGAVTRHPEGTDPRPSHSPPTPRHPPGPLRQVPVGRPSWRKTHEPPASRALLRGCRDALSPPHGVARPASPTLAAPAASPRRRSPASPPRPPRRCGCRSPGSPPKAGGSQESREGGPAPPRTCFSSSSLNPPGPRGRRPRRPALRRLSCRSPGRRWQPRVAYIGAPVLRPLHPSARAALCHWPPPPSGAPGRAAAGLGPGGVCSRPSCSGESVTRGRVLPAIARTPGHQVEPV